MTNRAAVAAIRIDPAEGAARTSVKKPRPFLKWAGGKTRLLPHLIPHVPPSFRNYHEPFVGGGAMFFSVRNRASGKIFLSDLNDELINTWQVARDRPVALGRALRRYKARDCEEFFYALRPLKPTTPLDRAARFIYLNQTSWNGLWRVNRWGEFNVPWGQRPFRGFSAEHLREIEETLRGVSIDLIDFRDTLGRVKRGDFVYLDPPYLPLSETSKFYLYTEKRFREPDLRELAEYCWKLTQKGAGWVLSNRDTPLVRELFGDAHIIGLTARRSVAAQNRRNVEKTDSPEVIVVGPWSK